MCRVIVKQGMPVRIVSSWGWKIWVCMHSRLLSAMMLFALSSSYCNGAPTELSWDGWDEGCEGVLESDGFVD